MDYFLVAQIQNAQPVVGQNPYNHGNYPVFGGEQLHPHETCNLTEKPSDQLDSSGGTKYF